MKRCTTRVRRTARPRFYCVGPMLAVLLGMGAAIASPVRAQQPWSASPVHETRPVFTTDFPPEEFAGRRARVYDAIGPDAIAIVQGAASPIGFVRFRQSNEFYYLSGIESPHAYLVLDGASRTAAVYLANRDERREFNEGKVLSAEDAALVMELSGIDAVHSTDVLIEHLQQRTARGGVRAVHTPFAPAEGATTTRNMALRAFADAAADPLDTTTPRHAAFVTSLRGLLPALAVEDLTPTLDRLRWVKSPREIELIRASTRLSGVTLLEAMRSTQPGVTEYELEAIGKYMFWRHGAQADAYYALVHVGSNAYMNHYHAGVREALPGDMILFDYGADYRYYTSDMTRMWPADGRFNPVQRELYGFYLAVYEALLNQIRPGLTAQQIRRAALVEIDDILQRWSFSKPTYATAARNFVDSIRRDAEHPTLRLGHWVGLAVHDPGVEGEVLRPGVIFTIEPQFRVPEERIYVRLEDMILITEDGFEVLGDFVPRDIDGIERVVQQGGGILQRYPRLLAPSGAFLPAAETAIRRD